MKKEGFRVGMRKVLRQSGTRSEAAVYDATPYESRGVERGN